MPLGVSPEVIELLMARVFSRFAFGSDHVLAAGVDAGPLLVLVDEAPLDELPPQAERATAAATAPATASATVARPRV
jgi:hypothetical protein